MARLLVVLILGAATLAAQEPTLTSSIGMELVLIRPGSFTAGRFQPSCPGPDAAKSWTGEDRARCEEMVKRDATPGFTATIERPFYIGRYEVTQAEWTRVMGTNPSTFAGDRHPVHNVTWADAQAFIRKLNALEPGARYRLPTELEWEYAARAGAEGEPSWPRIRETAWLALVDKGTTRPVGGKAPNAWGLHDTLGNVWEWVQDWYDEGLLVPPAPPRAGTVRVLKGGSFLGDVKNTTWSYHAAGPGSGFDVGFRVVREAR